MGTPAFPNLGKHCSVDDCKLIDFLPFTCDCCNKVFCLEHRSYATHQCPKGNKNDRTVVICPLCAKGVLLIPDQDPNITWESHINTDCDPSNYEKVTKKKKCPVRGCRTTLTFSTTVKCRQCTVDHCLKHRLEIDHDCPGPKKPDPSSFPFWVSSSSSSSSSSSWATSFLDVVSSIKAMTMLSNDTNGGGGGGGNGGVSGGQVVVEVCPICNMKFSKGADLINHVQSVHKQKGVMKVTIDVCPKCSKGFRGAAALVEHVEREHRGMSKA